MHLPAELWVKGSHVPTQAPSEVSHGLASRGVREVLAPLRPRAALASGGLHYGAQA